VGSQVDAMIWLNFQEPSTMELHWDYDYYQPWTDNEWIIEEMLTIQNKENKDDEIDDMSAHHH